MHFSERNAPRAIARRRMIHDTAGAAKDPGREEQHMLNGNKMLFSGMQATGTLTLGN